MYLILWGEKSPPPAALQASVDHSPLHNRTRDCGFHFAYQVNYIVRPFVSEENILCVYHILKYFRKKNFLIHSSFKK